MGNCFWKPDPSNSMEEKNNRREKVLTMSRILLTWFIRDTTQCKIGFHIHMNNWKILLHESDVVKWSIPSRVLTNEAVFRS